MIILIYNSCFCLAKLIVLETRMAPYPAGHDHFNSFKLVFDEQNKGGMNYINLLKYEEIGSGRFTTLRVEFLLSSP